MILDFKKRIAYNMDFKSRMAEYAGFFAGLSFFLYIFYYFGLQNMRDLGIVEILFMMLLPILLTGGMVVLIRIIRLPDARIYGVLGAAYFFLLLIRSVMSGSLVDMIFSALIYIPAGAVCVLVTFGYLLSKPLLCAAFAVPGALRALTVCIGTYLLKLDFIGFTVETGAVCGLFMFACLVMTMQGRPLNSKK